MDDLTCPQCGNTDQNLFFGMEIRGVYDGILFWVCQACDHAFPRGFSAPYQNIKSATYAAKYNEEKTK